MAMRGQRIDWEDQANEHGFVNDKAMLEAWYGKLMTQEEIGLKLDICSKTVSDRMRHHGITVRRQGSKPGEKRGPRLPRGTE